MDVVELLYDIKDTLITGMNDNNTTTWKTGLQFEQIQNYFLLS